MEKQLLAAQAGGYAVLKIRWIIWNTFKINWRSIRVKIDQKLHSTGGVCERSANTEVRRKINWIPVGAGFLLGLLISFYLVRLNGRIIPGVRVAGVPFGGMKYEQAYACLNNRLAAGQSQKVRLYYQKRTFDVILGTIGIRPDSIKTLQQAYALGRSGSFWQRLVTLSKAWRQEIGITVRFSHNQKMLMAFYRLLDASIGREPVRAVVRVGADGRVVYKSSIPGRRINRSRLTKLFEAAVVQGRSSHIKIPVDRVKPALTSADIRRWQLNRVLGIYRTMFNPQASKRIHNLKIAALAVNNVIVYPGQNFSFNTWVGPRMAKAGYKEAPIVFKGKLVPGIGGGVCQVSSTLYNAVLLANLDVIKRFNHSIPSAYVPLGRDATVADGGLDLIFKNNLAAPILLTAQVAPPYVWVAVLGEKKGWERVGLATEIVAQYPYQKREIIDPQLALGQVVTQPGKPGYKVNLWRTVFYQDGTSRKTLVSTSVYPAQPEEKKVGGTVP
jgi:vancomycin resistance protein YoaR